jgi:adenylate kinase family enzyme
MRCIAISGKMGSGKTTLTQEIMRQLDEAGIPAAHVSLAGPVKEVAHRYFGMEQGTKDRALLQAIGQGFRAIHPEVWIQLLQQRCGDSQTVYICDDVRFRNEVKALQADGWTLIRLPVSEQEQQRRLEMAYGTQWQEHWRNRFEASETDLDEAPEIQWSGQFSDLPLEEVPVVAAEIISSILNSKEVNA